VSHVDSHGHRGPTTCEVLDSGTLPSPTIMKGAQWAGCTSFGSPLSIIANMDRRKASARPTDLS